MNIPFEIGESCSLVVWEFVNILETIISVAILSNRTREM